MQSKLTKSIGRTNESQIATMMQSPDGGREGDLLPSKWRQSALRKEVPDLEIRVRVG